MSAEIRQTSVITTGLWVGIQTQDLWIQCRSDNYTTSFPFHLNICTLSVGIKKLIVLQHNVLELE
jgi:hypothetical protein